MVYNLTYGFIAYYYWSGDYSFSIIIHEVAHGTVAYYLGDPTAKESGRLNLNPFNHLDPLGSFIVPLFLLLLSGGKGPIVGWAKPVPIDFYNVRDKRWGGLKISLAGPLANLLLALIFGLFVRLPFFHQDFISFFTLLFFITLFWQFLILFLFLLWTVRMFFLISWEMDLLL